MPVNSSLSRTFWSIAFIIIIVLLAVSGWHYWNVYSIQRDNAQQRVQEHADKINGVLVSFMDNANKIAEHVADRIVEEKATLPQIVRIMHGISGNPKLYNITNWSGFSWADATDHIVANSSPAIGILRKPADITLRSYIALTRREPGRIFTSEPAIGAVSGVFTIPAGYGVVNKEGYYVGTITMGFTQQSLEQIVQQVVTDPGIRYVVVDAEGNLLVESPAYDFFSTHNLSREEMRTLAHGPESGLIPGKHYLKDSFIAMVYRRSGNHPFTILVSYDPALAKQQIFDTLTPRFVEVSVIGLFLLLILYVLHQRTVAPIVQLTGRITGKAQASVLSASLASSSREIMTLAQQLDQVSYVEELQRIRKELVRKTAQLQKSMEEAERARVEAERANHAKSQFLANMSHELRTPLNAIIAFSEVMDQGLFGSIENDRYRNYVHDIHHSGKHLLGLIEDLLDLSKAEAGMMQLQEQPVHLPALIHSAIQHVTSRMNGTTLIQADIPESLPPLLADEKRLRQLLINILRHQIHRCQDKGQVRVMVRELFLKGVEIQISDNGAAMTTEEIRQLFEVFSWPADARKHRQEDSLGLPLARHLIELHQGSIHVESVENRGTIITIDLPAERLMYGEALPNPGNGLASGNETAGPERGDGKVITLPTSRRQSST